MSTLREARQALRIEQKGQEQSLHIAGLDALDAAITEVERPFGDYITMLHRAKAIVEASPLYRRFIDGTPLSNDLAVWMADFALAVVRADAAPVVAAENARADAAERLAYRRAVDIAEWEHKEDQWEQREQKLVETLRECMEGYDYAIGYKDPYLVEKHGDREVVEKCRAALAPYTTEAPK